MSEPRPCQRCNSTDVYTEVLMDQRVKPLRITCRACNYSPDWWEETLEDAITYWNTRPIEDALTARAEAVEAEAKRLKEALTKIAEDPIIGMYQMREIAKKSLKGGEW